MGSWDNSTVKLVLEVLFWLSAATILYTYVGFPLLLFLRSRWCRRDPQQADITPAVSLIVVAHNEAACIRKKLDNLLALDYPRDCLDIIVASDGSDDGTNDIVAQYETKGIKLLALPRRGKIPTLNAAVAHASGEILAFSDANSLYTPNALRSLARPFADASVGGVAGNQSYIDGDRGSSAAQGERVYWNFDQQLKRYQSAAGSVTSATGAIYAIRRELFEPVPSGVCDDAVISYRVVVRGFRMMFEPEAKAYESVSSSARAEFRRKVRICARGLRGLLAVPQLFHPFHYGFYSLQLFSHKLLRWLLVWPLITLFLTSLMLHWAGPVYRLAAVVQLVFYGSALTFFLAQELTGSVKVPKFLALPFYFCLANTASLCAQWSVLQGQRIDQWDVRRSDS